MGPGATMAPMGLHVALHDDDLVVRTSGVDTALCLARELRIPRSAVTDVRLLPTRQAKAELGLRVGGGYFPGLLATGWFLWRRRKGLRQWWRVYRAAEVLVVDTTLRRPARLVLQLDDPAPRAFLLALGADRAPG